VGHLRANFSWVWAVALLGALAVAAIGTTPTAVHACSIVPPSTRTIGLAVEKSPVIALGEISSAELREAEFVVVESIRGTTPGEVFRLDNRGTYTAAACSPYDEPFQGGDRFAAGQSYVMMLERKVDGLWQIAYLGLAAFPVPANDDEKLKTDWYASGLGRFELTLGDIREQAATLVPVPTRPAGAGAGTAAITQPPFELPIASPGSGIEARSVSDAGAIARVGVMLAIAATTLFGLWRFSRAR